MPRRQVIGTQGLVTTPAGHLAPEGSASVANNVVCRRPGIYEPRLGIRSTPADPGSTADMRAVSWAAYRGRTYEALSDGTDWELNYTEDRGTNWAAISGMKPAPTPARHSTRMVTARDTLYVTCEQGVLRHDADTGATLVRSGLPRPGLVAALITGPTWPTWLPDGRRVAYRAVFRRDYDNGLVVRSAPSGRFVIANSAGAARGVTINVRLMQSLDAADVVVAGDVVELYRSAIELGEPDDELQLVAAQTITSTDIGNSVVSIQDACTDAARGALIYTAPSVGGAEAENRRAPTSDELALWADCLWAAGCTPEERALYKLNLGQDANWGYLPGLSGTTSVAGSNITGVSATTCGQLAVGMIVNEVGTAPGAASTRFSGNTRITAINSGAGTVTVSPAPLANAAITFYASDVVTVDSTDFVAWTDESASGSTLYHFLGSLTTDYPRGVAQSLAQRINIVLGGLPTVSALGGTRDDSSLIWEQPDGGGTLLAPTLTHSELWQIEPAVQPGRRADALYFSKNGEPEHFPPLNVLYAGNPNYRTLRLVPVGQVLYVMREDGVWRVTGQGQTFTVDPVTTSLHLIQPDAVAVWNDDVTQVAYALCGEGVYALSEGTQQLVSGPIQESLRLARANLSRAQATRKGAWVAIQEAERQVWVGIPTTNSIGYSTTQYVWCLDTNTWQTVDRELRAGWYNPYERVLWFGDGTSAGVRYQRKQTTTTDDWENYDDQRSLTPVSYTPGSTTIILDTGDAADVQVGDAFGDDAVDKPALSRVTGLGSNGLITLDTGLTLTGANVRHYVAFTSTLELNPISLNQPLRSKNWTLAALGFEDMTNLAWATLEVYGDFGNTPLTLSQTAPTSATPKTWSWTLPAAVAHCTRLRPRLAVRQAGAHWALAGLDLWFEPTGGRPR